MKIVPLLAITNAIALGLAILLFVEQDDLKSKLQAARIQRPETSSGIDRAEMEAMVRNILRDEAPATAVGTDSPDGVRVEDSAESGGTVAGAPAASADGTPEEGGNQPGTLAGRPMETFRQNVRQAQKLNKREDDVKTQVERLDQLVANGRIAALDPRVKKAVAAKVLGFRERAGLVWREMRTKPEVREMSREDRWKYMQEEFKALSETATKELEKLVQPADAKTIVESSIRGRGGDRGRRGSSTPGRAR